MSAAGPHMLAEASEAVRPMDFEDYREYLEAVYLNIKGRLKSYSYVAFSIDLGLGNSNMVHLIVRGKRHIRLSGIRKIAASLQLKGEARRYLELLHTLAITRNPDQRGATLQRIMEMRAAIQSNIIDKSRVGYYSAWYHPVVRELVCMADFDGTPEWISDHILPSITVAQAAQSLTLLENLGFLERDRESRRFKQTDCNVRLESGSSELAVTQYHQTVIDLAKRALHETPWEKREIRSYTLGVSKKKAEMIKELIQELEEKLIALVSGDTEVECVTQLNIQLFPESKD